VLARLDQIDGVESSYANESGTLIRLALRPNANLTRVTGAVRRVLSEQVENRVPVQLSRQVAAVALQREEWRDKGQLAELAATEMSTTARRAPWLLAVLLLGLVAVGLGFLGWRYRRKSTAR
jgi:hypothetical protein